MSCTQLPMAIGPGDEPIVTVELMIGDDPEDVDPTPGDEVEAAAEN